MNKVALKEGDILPKFALTSSTGDIIDNKSIAGKNTLLFIYPKDNSPSCTKEAQSFSQSHIKFRDLGVTVYGISIDSLSSHKKFISKYSLTVDLLSDETKTFVADVGCWVEKSMYGKKYMGVERTTILIAKDGTILKIWKKVKVNGHVDEIFSFLNQKHV